jgi:hypothetical protein
MAHASLSPHPDPAAAALARRRVVYGEVSCHTRTAASSGCGDDDDDYTWRKWQEPRGIDRHLPPSTNPTPTCRADERGTQLPRSLSLCLRVSRGPGVEIRVEWKEVERKRGRERGWEGWWC